MHDWIVEAARRRPAHPFLVTPKESHSFAEIAARVRSAAVRLRRAGVVESSVVGLWATNDLRSVVGMLALWRVGATAQLVNTRLTAIEVAEQLRDTNAHFLIGGDLDVPGTPRLEIDITPTEGGIDPVEIPESRVAWIVFTSGSTGRPKGVRLTFGNLEASARASALHLDHQADERWLCDLPVFHVGGASILVRSLREATTVLLEPRFDPLRSAALLRAGDATVASVVATTLSRILEVHPGRYTGVHAVMVGGGPVPFDLLQLARRAGLPAVATYGMTETASQVATGRLSDGKVVAVPGADIRTVDGRIQVRGPMVFRGYVGQTDREAGAWFETGDLGVFRRDGSLDVVGRADDLIISGGEKVHPGEVEAVIAEHPKVDAVVVVGQPDPRWGQAVVAVYEGGAAPGELERHARYRLAGYKIPRRWVRVDTLPRLSIGKVDRQATTKLIRADEADDG